MNPIQQNQANNILGLRNRAPKTIDELDDYLRTFYNVYLASQPIDDGNSSPLHFVWDVYSSALGITDTPSYNILGCATRGGQKSLSCAILEALILQHDRRNIVHMASIKEQAYVTYEHFKRIITRKSMQGVTSEPTQKETRSLKYDTTISISTATMDSVNSKHVSLLVQDELDLTPAKIFNESQGMLSAELNKLPINVCISSRKFAIGNVQKILDSLKNNPGLWKVHKWGVLEFTQKCLPKRHGEFGEQIYVNDDDLIAISTEEYETLTDTQKNKYEKLTGYKNCLSCGIFSFCKGRLPKQKTGNPWLQPIDVTRQQFKKEAPAFFKAQRLNRKPSKRGLVYPMYEPEIHEKTYGEMWEIFQGEPHPDLIVQENGRSLRKDITLDELVMAFIKAGCTCVVGVDFGFSILAVCGLYFIDGSGRVYFVDEISRQGFSDAEIAEELKNLWGHYPVEKVYADPESPGGQKEIRKSTGWSIHKEVDKSVDEGVSTMQKLMRVPGTRATRFYVSHNCTTFREECPNYHYKIDPKTEEPTEVINKANDHSCDQCRYVTHTIFGNRAQTDLGFSGGPEKTFDIQKPVERAPNATELGELVSPTFTDNRDGWVKINGQWIKKEDDSSNDPGSTGGGGGFFWTN